MSIREPRGRTTALHRRCTVWSVTSVRLSGPSTSVPRGHEHAARQSHVSRGHPRRPPRLAGAVHPIRNLVEFKRRLDVGRRCFRYLLPSRDTRGAPDFHQSCSPRHGHICTGSFIGCPSDCSM